MIPGRAGSRPPPPRVPRGTQAVECEGQGGAGSAPKEQPGVGTGPPVSMQEAVPRLPGSPGMGSSSGTAARCTGGTGGGLGAVGPAGRAAGGCRRLGKGCRAAPNSPTTKWGRRDRGGGRSARARRPRPLHRSAAAVPAGGGCGAHLPRSPRFLPRPPPRGRNETGGPRPGAGRWGGGPRGPGPCLPELAVWLLSSCPGARASGCRWTLWGSESTSRKVGCV